MTEELSFTAPQLWRAIDRIIALRGLNSPHKLAVMSGLHASALNKSKRKDEDGKWRWLTLQTISKILAATDLSTKEFAKMLED